MGKEPGYLKNSQLLIECGGEEDNKPLKQLIENKSDLKAYCPTCYVLRGVNKKHCFICNKCVEEMSHHCFWLNRCIGKKNKRIYVIFIFSTFLYAFYCIFICSNLIADTVNIPYKIFPDWLSEWLYLSIDRGFRVLAAAIVFIFSSIVSFPLFFLFMIEMFKLCGLLGKKKYSGIEINDENNIKNDKEEHLELQVHGPLLNEIDDEDAIN